MSQSLYRSNYKQLINRFPKISELINQELILFQSINLNITFLKISSDKLINYFKYLLFNYYVSSGFERTFYLNITRSTRDKKFDVEIVNQT